MSGLLPRNQSTSSSVGNFVSVIAQNLNVSGQAVISSLVAGTFSVANLIINTLTANQIDAPTSLSINTQNGDMSLSTDNTERLKISSSGINTDNTITNILGLQGTTLSIKNNLIDTNTSAIVSNKKFVDNSTSIINNSDNTKQLTFSLGGQTTGTITNILSSSSINRNIILPNISDTLVSRINFDTLSNKSIDSGSNTLTITNSPLSNTNINSLINQDVRTTASPLFSFLSTTNDINCGNAVIAGSVVGQSGGVVSTSTMNSHVYADRVNDGIILRTNGVDRLFISPSGIANNNTITNILGLDGSNTLFYKNNLVDTTSPQTLSSKTLTSPTIATITNAGTLTLPTGIQTLVGRTTSDTLTNKNLTDNSTFIIDIGDATKRLGFDVSGITGTTTTLATTQTSNIVINLPNANTTLVGTDNGVTFLNKIIESTANNILITSSPLVAQNINLLLNQDVRTTASPTFTSAVNLTQSGNTTFSILSKADYAYSAANGAFFTNSIIGDINIRNQDNTKNFNLGVGSGTSQLSINNTGINYTQPISGFTGSTRAHNSTPLSGSSAANVTTTMLTIPVPTNTSIAIFLYLSTRKLTGTITGYGSYIYDWKSINVAGTVSANNGNNQAKSEQAISGAYSGKTNPTVAVSTTNINVNLTNTFADGTLVWAGYVEVLFS